MIRARSYCAVNDAGTLLAVYDWDFKQLDVYDTATWTRRSSKNLTDITHPSRLPGLCFVSNTNNVLVTAVPYCVQEFAISETTYEIARLRTIRTKTYCSANIACDGAMIVISSREDRKIQMLDYVSELEITQTRYQNAAGLLVSGSKLLVCDMGGAVVYEQEAATCTALRSFKTLPNPCTIVQVGEHYVVASRNGEIWVHDSTLAVVCRCRTGDYGPTFVAKRKVYTIGDTKMQTWPSVNWHLGLKRVFIQACVV